MIIMLSGASVPLSSAPREDNSKLINDAFRANFLVVTGERKLALVPLWRGR
jgi:hypothetical protein